MQCCPLRLTFDRSVDEHLVEAHYVRRCRRCARRLRGSARRRCAASTIKASVGVGSTPTGCNCLMGSFPRLKPGVSNTAAPPGRSPHTDSSSLLQISPRRLALSATTIPMI